MPRGEETQEPQEKSRDQSKEIREQPQEVQRDQEVVAQPEAVVERERPVEESEAIEAAVVEAVEAASRDNTPRTGESSVPAANEDADAAALPVRVPGVAEVGDGDPVAALPVPFPDVAEVGEGDPVATLPVPVLGVADVGEGDPVAALPVPFPDVAEVGDGDPVAALPVPVLGVADVGEGDPVAALPVPFPDVAEVGDGDPVAALPVPVPGVADVGEGDPVAALPVPVLGVADVGEEDPVAALPVPFPDVAEVGEGDPFPDPSAQRPDRDLPLAERAVEENIEPSSPEQKAGAPSQPLVERELPQGGQMEEGYEQQEDLQDLAEGDLGSLMPEGKLTGPDGKESKDSKLGDGLGGMPGMDSRGKIDGSSEDPSGDQFAGKGTFKPGKGPGGGETEGGGPGKDYTYTEDEVNVMELITGGASKEQIAAKERQLQEKALDEFQLIYTSPTDTPPGEQKTDKEDPPKPKPKTSSESTPEEGGGSDVHAVSQEEFTAVIDKVGGGQISNQDPDDQSGGEPDGRLKPEAAKKIKDAMDQAASTKHKQKKAGAELITDPDQEDPEGGDLGRKLDVDKDI